MSGPAPEYVKTAPIKAGGGYLIAPMTDGACKIKSPHGFVYDDRYASVEVARQFVAERLAAPQGRAIAVRCIRAVAPLVFDARYVAVPWRNAHSGHTDILMVYVPNLKGTFTAIGLSASLFVPVNPIHNGRFVHTAGNRLPGLFNGNKLPQSRERAA